MMMTAARKLALALTLMAPLAALAGGEAAQGQAAPAAAASGADDAKTEQVINTACTQCHDTSVFTATPHKANEWGPILQKMVGYSPDLANLDLKAIEAYLAAHYSK